MEKITNLINGIETVIMYRGNIGYHRVYLTREPVKIYSGITNALDTVTFKGNVDNKRLDGWRKTMIDNFGRQQQEAYVSATADFGTLCHEALVRIWTNRGLVWQDEQDYARQYFIDSCNRNNIPVNETVLQKQIFEYCKTAAALMTFINEQVKEIYAIEGMCKSEEFSIATPIDIVCKLNDDRVCTINLKTSDQFNDKHRDQVAMEWKMWNETYPDLQADCTALLRGKDWSMKKGIPTYEFEIVQNPGLLISPIIEKLRIALKSESDTYLRFPREQVVFSGVTKIGEKPTFETRKIEDVIFESQEELI